MNLYELPTELAINGKQYRIRSDYRAILDILKAQNDPDLDQQTRTYVLIKIFYPDWKTIPYEDLEEAVRSAIRFIDCGEKEEEGRKRPTLMDWQQDAALIIPAINSVAHMEVRAVPYMHWWTFFGYYMEIGESLFSNVLNIRAKKAKGKKLEKYEKEFERENRDLIQLKKKETEEERAEREYLEQWLGGGE